jgi:2-oxoglutarate ferredoxin oxidoreductase subunit beta
MVELKDLETGEKCTWCPGCGDYGIWLAVKKAIVELNLDPEKTLIVYGIGCSGHMCNYVKTYAFEGLHGRPIPVAVAAKMANHDLHVIVVAGDGDTYGEGVNHLTTAMRGNHDITVIVHNNKVYGLTTGQASPTSDHKYKSKSTPRGMIESPVNPMALGIASDASFLAKGFSGDVPRLTETIKAAITHKGFALVDIFQNCISFNHVNTVMWYKDRVYPVEQHDATSKVKALELALKEDKLPIGILYKKPRPTYEDELPQLKKGTQVSKGTDQDIDDVMPSFV